MRHRLLVLVTLWMLEAKMSIEAMKQALEYLQENQHLIADNERHAYVMQYNAFIEELEAAIEQAEKQEPPPECQTESEKRAYAFGWLKAMDYVRQNGIIGKTK